MKEKILITGATGNVGLSLLKFINTSKYDVYLAVRDVDKLKNIYFRY